MKVIICYIIILATNSVLGQDSLLQKLSLKYSKEYALISIEVLKQKVGIPDLNLNHVPPKTFVLLPLRSIYDSEKADLERMIKENKPTNDPDWKTKQKILLDTLENILNKGNSIYLDSNNYNEVYKLLFKYSINNFFNKKTIILLQNDEDDSFGKLKYKARRIGAWRHFKIKGAKDEFYLYYVLNSTGSIYQRCYDGSSTLLGRIIMNIQRIGW